MKSDKEETFIIDPIDRMERMRVKVIRRIKDHQRALLVSKSAYDPNPVSVVTLTHAYKRFATGYIEVMINGAKIPYTLNYVDLLDHEFAETSHWENGDSIYD